MSNSTAQAPSQGIDLFLLPSRALRTGHGVSWLGHVGLREQIRAAEYKNPEDALNFAAQHTLMRCMLASALGIKATAAADIEVDRTCLLCEGGAQHGKPRVQGLEFSMSRSAGMVAGALTPQALLLGVDIERIRGSYFTGFDRIALGEAEKQAIGQMTQTPAQVARHLLWTAKEAVLKATGHGLVAGPHLVAIRVENFPTTFDTADGFSAPATLTLEGQDEQQFWVNWQVRGEFVVAVAANRPHSLRVHEVATPLAVRQVLEKFAPAPSRQVPEAG